MNLTILSSCSPQWEQLHSLTGPNKEEYCDRWDANFIDHRISVNDQQQGWWWVRASLWRDELNKISDGDYLWFLGADTLIMNQTIDWKSVATGADIIIGRDCNGINSDSFFIRRTAKALELLDLTLSNPDHQQNEQDSLSKAIDKNICNSSVVHQRVLNSYLYKYYPQHPGNEDKTFQEGDFVLHVPGMSYESKLKVLAENFSKIIK